jgi:ribonuclease HI
LSYKKSHKQKVAALKKPAEHWELNKSSNRMQKTRRPSRTEVNNLKKEINLLRDQLDSLKQSVAPMIKEREALEESKDKILISCDASCVNGVRAAIGVIIRSVALKDIYQIGRPTPSKTSNEAELDALYAAIDCLSSILLQTLKDNRVKNIEIRSDSQLCVGWITGKKQSKIPRFINKINIIRENVKALSMLCGKNIKFIWRRRNSSHDLLLANNLAQSTNGVKLS